MKTIPSSWLSENYVAVAYCALTCTLFGQTVTVIIHTGLVFLFKYRKMEVENKRRLPPNKWLEEDTVQMHRDPFTTNKA